MYLKFYEASMFKRYSFIDQDLINKNVQEHSNFKNFKCYFANNTYLEILGTNVFANDLKETIPDRICP